MGLKIYCAVEGCYRDGKHIIVQGTERGTNPLCEYHYDREHRLIYDAWGRIYDFDELGRKENRNE
jgi:hypothetical protein